MESKDRGVIKWTALMLPEHVKELRSWQDELKQVQPNELHEWELANLQQTIARAYHQNVRIQLTTYSNRLWQNVEGMITALHIQQQQLIVQTQTAQLTIHLPTIQHAEVDDSFD